ncbi:sulfatase-like hydrolase/transferase [Brachybacterium muris]|uniref:sulfatase-like hydrolase/transferase n=1 Tax=Brachybacterium muris TaxID=219301 RepID=UPI0003450A8E
MTDRPNIILVCVDEMRADAFGAAGNEQIDTPNLDELARGGYRFSRAYSATPTCVPARVAMFTGKSPELHGRYGYRDGIDFHSAYPVTLQSTLREAGYQAFGVGKMHVFPARARCGFDDVLLHDGFMHITRTLAGGAHATIDDYVDFLRRETGDPRADYQETGLGCNAIVARPWEREERLHPTRWVADESVHFIERRDPTRPSGPTATGWATSTTSATTTGSAPSSGRRRRPPISR